VGDGDKPVLGAGHFFGEFSVLANRPALATCRVKTEKCTLLSLDKGAFLHLFATDPELLAYMHVKLLQGDCSLSDVLRYKKAHALFASYLAMEFADEALQFHDAVEAYRQLPAEAQQAEAEQLVVQFVSDTAETQINIPHKMRVETMAEVRAQQTSARTFDSAFEENFKLMERDNFHRFVQGDEFAGLLKEIEAYSTGEEGNHSLEGIDNHINTTRESNGTATGGVLQKV